MAFTTTTKVRQLTNGRLTNAKVSDGDLDAYILQATSKVNGEINVKVREETVRFIDSWRKNDFRDGTTTTFYVKNGVTNYLSDADNDGEVTITDVSVFKLSNEDVRTELTVSAIDSQDGGFTVSAAPGTDTRELTVTYSYSFYDVTIPDLLVELLTGYLAASYAYFADEHGLGSSVKFGNIRFDQPAKKTSYTQYLARYEDLLKRVLIPSNKPKMGTSKHLI